MKYAGLAMVVAGLIAGACQPPERVRVGLIDAARLIQSTPQGKRVRARLRKEEARLNAQLQGPKLRMKQLAMQIKALTEQKPPDQEKIRQKRALIRAEVRKLREKHALFEGQLQKIAGKLLEKFRQDVEKLAKQVQVREGYDIIIYRSKSAGVWIWPAKDITDKLIDRMDADSAE